MDRRMVFSSGWVRGHVTELLLLPFTAACAAASWAVIVNVALLPQISASYVAGLVLLSLLTVYTAVAITVLGLPVSLHMFGVALALLLSIFSPGGISHVVLTGLAWVAAVLLGGVCAVAVPAQDASAGDPFVAERLDELRTEKRIYAVQRSWWMARAVQGRAAALVISAFGMWLLSGAFNMGMSGQERNTYLTIAVGVLLFSLNLFTGLIRLFSHKCRWQEDPSLYVPSTLSDAWPVMLIAALLAVLLVAVLLPVDLSPLYAVDWNPIMDRLTVRLFGRVRPDAVGLQPGGTSFSRSSTGGTSFSSGGGFELVPVLYVLVAVGLLGWAAVNLVRHLMSIETNRGRNMLRILKALALFPFTLLATWWRNLTSGLMRRLSSRLRPQPITAQDVREQEPARAKSVPLSVESLTVRRLFVLLLRWAAEQGSRRRREQTANEFADMLKRRFPSVAADIGFVAEAYEWSRYSPRQLDATDLKHARMAYRRIVRSRQ